MADQAVTTGTAFGATFALTTNSTFTGDLFRIDKGWEMMRTAVETTHSSSTNGWKTFIAGDIKEMGTLEITVNYNTQLQYHTLFAAGCDTLTLTFPKRATTCGGTVAVTAATFASSVVFEKASAAFPFDDRMAITLTFRLSGSPTIVAATTA
jgi:hypothetical protein